MNFNVCKASNIPNAVKGKVDNGPEKDITENPQPFELESDRQKLVWWIEGSVADLHCRITLINTAPQEVNVTIGGN